MLDHCFLLKASLSLVRFDWDERSCQRELGNTWWGLDDVVEVSDIPDWSSLSNGERAGILAARPMDFNHSPNVAPPPTQGANAYSQQVLWNPWWCRYTTLPFFLLMAVSLDTVFACLLFYISCQPALKCCSGIGQITCHSIWVVMVTDGKVLNVCEEEEEQQRFVLYEVGLS